MAQWRGREILGMDMEEKSIADGIEKKKTTKKSNGLAMVLVALCVTAVMLYYNVQVLYLNPISVKRDVPAEEMSALYRNGRQAVEEEAYVEAIGMLRDVSGYLNADELYAQAVEGYRAEVDGEVDGYLRDHHFAQALDGLRDAQSVLQGNVTVETYIAQVEQQYAVEIFTSVARAVKEDQYDEALTMLETLKDDIPSIDTVVQRRIDEVKLAYHEHNLVLSEAAYKMKDYALALALLADAEARTGSSEALLVARQRITSERKADFLSLYDAQFKAGAYDEAIAIMAEAEAVFPEDTAFPARRRAAEAAKERAEAEALAAEATAAPTTRPTQLPAAANVENTASPAISSTPTAEPTPFQTQLGI